MPPPPDSEKASLWTEDPEEPTDPDLPTQCPTMISHGVPSECPLRPERNTPVFFYCPRKKEC